MIIRRVELVNFLSHRHTEINFDTGIVAIVGPNGAGKSSIIDAITFALFDTHSRSMGSKKSNKILVRLGAPYALVRVVFEVGGRHYLVERRIDANGHTSHIALYNVSSGSRQLLARDVRSVYAEIEKILGVKKNVAKVAFIAQQGELAALLEMGNKRKEYVKRLLGLDLFEKAYQIIRHIHARWSERVSLTKRLIDDKRAELRRIEEEIKKLEGVEKELARVEEELERTTQEISEIEGRLEELNDLLSILHQKRAVLEYLENDLDKLQKELEELEARKQELERKIGELEEYTVLEDKIDLLRRAVDNIVKLKQLAKLKKSIEDVVKREDEIRSRLHEVEARMKELEPYLEVERELIELQARLASISEQMKRVQERASAISEEQRRLQQLVVRELSSLLGFNLPAGAPPEEIRGRLESLEKSMEAELERVEKSIEAVRNEKARLEAQADELGKRLSILARASSRCPVCGKPLTESERLALIRKYRVERDAIMEKVDRLEDTLDELLKRREALRKKLEVLRQKRNVIERYLARLEEGRKQLQSLEEERRKLDEEAKKIRIRLLEARDVKDKVEELRRLEEEYNELRAQLAHVNLEKARLSDIERDMLSIYEELEGIAESLGVDLDTLVKLSYDDIRAIESKINEYKSLSRELNEIEARINELQREISDKIAEIEEIRSELEKLARVEQEYGELREKLASLKELASKLREKKGGLERDVKRYRELVERRGQLQREIEKLEAEYTRMKLVVSDLEKLKNAFSPSGLPMIIRSLARSLIEKYMRDVLARFNIDFIDVNVTEDYDVRLVTRQGVKEFGMLSGGEKTALALAFRIALARVLAGKSRINMMILDEPTLYLDEQRKRELINILRYGWHGGDSILPQLIIVTHDREIEEAADQVIEVKRDANNESRVEIITPAYLA